MEPSKPVEPSDPGGDVERTLPAPEIKIRKLEWNGFNYDGRQKQEGVKYYTALFTDSSYQELAAMKGGWGSGGAWFDRAIFQPGSTYYLGAYYLAGEDSNRQRSKWTYFTVTIPEHEFELEAPTNLKVTTTSHSITVTFDPVEGAAQYGTVIYTDGLRLAKNKEATKSEWLVEDTTYTWDQNLESGTTYYLGIYAYNMKTGDRYVSRYSDIVWFTATTTK